LDALAQRADVVTYEFENVPVAAAHRIAAAVPVYPPVAALGAAQDRLAEKRLFEDLGIPVPEWRDVGGAEDIARAVAEIGLPLVLKTRRLGYDGKGQVRLERAEDVAGAWDRLGRRPAIAERRVPFRREVSIIG